MFFHNRDTWLYYYWWEKSFQQWKIRVSKGPGGIFVNTASLRDWCSNGLPLPLVFSAAFHAIPFWGIVASIETLSRKLGESLLVVTILINKFPTITRQSLTLRILWFTKCFLIHYLIWANDYCTEGIVPGYNQRGSSQNYQVERTARGQVRRTIMQFWCLATAPLWSPFSPASLCCYISWDVVLLTGHMTVYTQWLRLKFP